MYNNIKWIIYIECNTKCKKCDPVTVGICTECLEIPNMGALPDCECASGYYFDPITLECKGRLYRIYLYNIKI